MTTNLIDLQSSVPYHGYLQAGAPTGMKILLTASGSLVSIAAADVLAEIEQPSTTTKLFDGKHVVLRVKRSAPVSITTIALAGRDPISALSSCSSADGQASCTCGAGKKCKSSGSDCWCEDA
jgi:hypothetical protein